eukprot:288269_1
MSAFTRDDIEILASVITNVLLLLYIISIMRSGILFHKFQDEISLYKRYGDLTMKATRFAIFQFSFSFMFELADTWCFFIDCKNPSIVLFLRQITFMMHLIGLQIVYHYFILRYWILYYQMMIIQSLWDNQWKKVILYNDKHNQNVNEPKYDKLSWYIDNEQTYGNYQWIWKRLLFLLLIPLIIIGPIFYTLEPLIYESFNGLKHEIVLYTNLVSFLIPLFILFFIYYKIPKNIYDNFYIYNELFLIITFLAIWCCIASGKIYNDSYYGSKDTTFFITSTIFRNVLNFDEFCTIMIATYWVISQQLSQLKTSSSVKLNANYHKTMIVNPSPTALSKALQAKYDKNLFAKNVSGQSNRTNLLISPKFNDNKFVKMFSDTVAFTEFIDYFIMDMSVKNMMAFIEILQYQKFVDEYCDSHNICLEVAGSLYNVIEFNLNIPKSYIVYSKFAVPNNFYLNVDEQKYNDQDESNFIELIKYKSHLIFEKYINYGAFYGIDLDNKTRMDICVDMDNKFEWFDRDDMDCIKLCELFNGVANIIFAKIRSSYFRFVTYELKKKKK